MENEISKKEIRNLISESCPLILDIGCYDGSDGADIAALFGCAEVHCFECDPRSIKLFKEHHSDNSDLFLHEFALGKVNGKIGFYQSDSPTRRHYLDQTSWSASSSTKEPKKHLSLFPDVTFPKKIKVECQTLDFWYEKNIDDEVIDFIWADVNGGEGDLILGGLKTLNNKTRFIYIEFSDKELYENQVTQQTILDMLFNFELVEVYNFRGNFGNLLLKNKTL